MAINEKQLESLINSIQNLAVSQARSSGRTVTDTRSTKDYEEEIRLINEIYTGEERLEKLRDTALDSLKEQKNQIEQNLRA